MAKAKRKNRRANKLAKTKPIPSKSFQLNKRCSYLNELKNFVLRLAPPTFPKIEKDLHKLGRIKLAIVTGIFLSLKDTRVDLMVVGDGIDFKKFTDFIKKLEGDMGVELRYVVLGTDEFKYRRDMFDRFVLDILEYPNRRVVNRLSL